MADETLEQKAKTAPPENQEKKEQKPKEMSMLQSVGSDLSDLVKFSASIAAPVAQGTLLPIYARDTAILTGAQIAGDATTARKRGERFGYTNLLESSLMGTALTIPQYHMFDLINRIPTDTALGIAAKAGAWGGLAYPAFLGLYQFTDYLIKKRTFKGLGKYMKENYWNTVKTAWKYALPFSLLNVFFAPPILQIPISALLSYVVTLFGAPKKAEVPEEKKRDPTPYSVAASNVIYKLGQSVFKIPYSIGTAIYELAKPTPKAPAAPTAPAGRPVTQPA